MTKQIRKNKHQEVFKKRRNVQNKDTQQSFMFQQPIPDRKKPLIIDQERKEQIQKFIKSKYLPHMFPQLVQFLTSDDIILKHQGIIGIRKILSTDNSPPIYLVFQHNILPYIFQLMKQNQFPHLKLQATWIVSNIATGSPNQIQALLKFDIIPILLSFLSQNIFGVADQAIWAIGNLAGDSSNIRDLIIDQGGISPIIFFINNTQSLNNQIQGSWALSNLCRGTPLPEYEKVKQAGPILCKVINSKILDIQNLADCVWALNYLTQGPKNRLNILFQSQILSNILEIAKSNSLQLAAPSLRILGNVSTGSQIQTGHLFKINILQVLQELIGNKKALVRRQICWIISNIAAGTRHQVNQLLSRTELLDKTIYLFQHDSTDIKRQICHIFANMTYLGDPIKLKHFLIQKQIIKYYGNCITQVNNIKLLQTCLDVLPMLFNFGQKIKDQNSRYNVFIQKFLSYQGVRQSFQNLCTVDSQRIYKKAEYIYNAFFDGGQGKNKYHDEITI